MNPVTAELIISISDNSTRIDGRIRQGESPGIANVSEQGLFR